MKNETKTKERLIQELQDFHQKVVQIERLKAEHKNVTKALLESENLYKMIFESANDGIIIHDTEGRIFDVNRTMYKRLGFTKQELLKMSLKDLVTHEFSKRVSERMSLLKKEGVAIFESADRRKDGTVMPVEVSARYVDYKGQKVILSIVRDIHERKLAEDLILSALQEKDILLKEINRQIRFDLEIFFRMMEKLSRTKEEHSPVKAAQEIQSRIKTIAYIKERLYSFPSLSKIDFAEFTTRLVRFVSTLYPSREKGVNITNKVQNIYLDIVKAIPLALIINEMLSNSLKHAFHGNNKGKIIIEIRKKENGKYILRFFDNGIGFPKSFDFKNTATIGMQIVNDLVDQLHGKIELNTDKGTEFMVQF
ncbi:MAG: PAS domain S-box protein [Candidatus Aminicenantes bacterium]|jgi:PAS domain S-box-containing protein